MDVGLLALHGIAGLLLTGHGVQKLLGAFRGNGVAGTALGIDVHGPGWAPATLGAGLLGGLGAIASGRLAARGEGHGAHPQAA